MLELWQFVQLINLKEKETTEVEQKTYWFLWVNLFQNKHRNPHEVSCISHSTFSHVRPKNLPPDLTGGLPRLQEESGYGTIKNSLHSITSYNRDMKERRGVCVEGSNTLTSIWTVYWINTCIIMQNYMSKKGNLYKIDYPLFSF